VNHIRFSLWRGALAAPLLLLIGPPFTSDAHAAPGSDGDDTSELVGHRLPDWTTDRWYNSPPLRPKDLLGKVVLIRWFAGPTCSRCRETASVFRSLWDEFRDRGLVIIGMYHHHRSQLPVEEEARRTVELYGFEFPVAIDSHWQTIKRWWLEARPNRTSSISVLVDRAGVVRYVHKGGLIAPDSCESADLRARVQQLLAPGAR
jgi:peroxiredoxin